jgi:uncharacterized glyoxalase superfamily protein PhnB
VAASRSCTPIIHRRRRAPSRSAAQGVCLEFQVADAGAEYARFQQGGAAIALSLRDEPFGQRRFGLFDPAGAWIDIVEQIESARAGGTDT